MFVRNNRCFDFFKKAVIFLIVILMCMGDAVRAWSVSSSARSAAKALAVYRTVEGLNERQSICLVDLALRVHQGVPPERAIQELAAAYGSVLESLHPCIIDGAIQVQPETGRILRIGRVETATALLLDFGDFLPELEGIGLMEVDVVTEVRGRAIARIHRTQASYTDMAALAHAVAEGIEVSDEIIEMLARWELASLSRLRGPVNVTEEAVASHAAVVRVSFDLHENAQVLAEEYGVDFQAMADFLREGLDVAEEGDTYEQLLVRYLRDFTPEALMEEVEAAGRDRAALRDIALRNEALLVQEMLFHSNEYVARQHLRDYTQYQAQLLFGSELFDSPAFQNARGLMRTWLISATDDERLIQTLFVIPPGPVAMRMQMTEEIRRMYITMLLARQRTILKQVAAPPVEALVEPGPEAPARDVPAVAVAAQIPDFFGARFASSGIQGIEGGVGMSAADVDAALGAAQTEGIYTGGEIVAEQFTPVIQTLRYLVGSLPVVLRGPMVEWIDADHVQIHAVTGAANDIGAIAATSQNAYVSDTARIVVTNETGALAQYAGQYVRIDETGAVVVNGQQIGRVTNMIDGNTVEITTADGAVEQLQYTVNLYVAADQLANNPNQSMLPNVALKAYRLEQAFREGRALTADEADAVAVQAAYLFDLRDSGFSMGGLSSAKQDAQVARLLWQAVQAGTLEAVTADQAKILIYDVLDRREARRMTQDEIFDALAPFHDTGLGRDVFNTAVVALHREQNGVDIEENYGCLHADVLEFINAWYDPRTEDGVTHDGRLIYMMSPVHKVDRVGMMEIAGEINFWSKDAIYVGQAFVFPHPCSTDTAYPTSLTKWRTQLLRAIPHIFSSADSAHQDFGMEVRRGDHVVVRSSKEAFFGSSRKSAPETMFYAGVGSVLSEKFARIFLRNCMNLGLPAVFLDEEVLAEIEDGHIIEVDVVNGIYRNLTTGTEREFPGLPEFMQQIVIDGSVLAHLAKNRGKFAAQAAETDADVAAKQAFRDEIDWSPGQGGKTLTRKLMENLAGHPVTTGEYILAEFVPGSCVGLQDSLGGSVLRTMQEWGLLRYLKDPEMVKAYFDHFTDCRDEISHGFHAELLAFFRALGIEPPYVGKGVIHQGIFEEHAKPRTLVVTADSHGTTMGGLGCAGTGGGVDDAVTGLCSKRMPMRVPETMAVRFKGKLPPGVTAKDVVLHLCNMLGTDGASYMSMEFFDEDDALDVEGRGTVSNMAVEMGAKFGLFQADQKTRAYLKEQGREEDYQEAYADENAQYDHEVEIDLSELRPVVAVQPTVDNVMTLDEAKAAVEKLGHTYIQQAFVGSCTNGRVPDIMAVYRVCRVLKEAGIIDHPPEGTRFLISPASKAVEDECAAELEWLRREFRAIILTPGCNACFGRQRAPGVTWSTGNRDFPDRAGKSANPDMPSCLAIASPMVVAVAAAYGRAVTEEEYMEVIRILEMAGNLDQPNAVETALFARNIEDIPGRDPIDQPFEVVSAVASAALTLAGGEGMDAFHQTEGATLDVDTKGTPFAGCRMYLLHSSEPPVGFRQAAGSPGSEIDCFDYVEVTKSVYLVIPIGGIQQDSQGRPYVVGLAGEYDGTSWDVYDAAKKVVNAAMVAVTGKPVHYLEAPYGFWESLLQRHDETQAGQPHESIPLSIQKHLLAVGTVLKAPFSSAIGAEYVAAFTVEVDGRRVPIWKYLGLDSPQKLEIPSLNLRLRAAMGCYGGLRPSGRWLFVRNQLGDEYPRNPERFVIYPDDENWKAVTTWMEERGIPLPPEGAPLHIAETSLEGAERLVRLACEQARERGETRVTVAGVGRILPGLQPVWDDAVATVRDEYTDVEIDVVDTDELARRMAEEHAGITAHRLGVIAGSNLSMDILSDLGAALGEGGIGNAPGGQMRRDGRNVICVGEAVGGTALKYMQHLQEGRAVINPTALIRSAIFMLELAGHREVAEKLQQALTGVLENAPDSQVTRHIVRARAAARGDRIPTSRLAEMEAAGQIGTTGTMANAIIVGMRRDLDRADITEVASMTDVVIDVTDRRVRPTLEAVVTDKAKAEATDEDRPVVCFDDGHATGQYSSVRGDGDASWNGAARAMVATGLGTVLPDDSAVEVIHHEPEAVHAAVEDAFRYAHEHGYNTVTVVTKQNVVKSLGQVWLDALKAVSAAYPDIEAKSIYIDNVTAQLGVWPEGYGVLVGWKPFMDIVRGVAAGLGLDRRGELELPAVEQPAVTNQLRRAL